MASRTYMAPAGEHAGNINGAERRLVIPGTAGEDTEVTLSDPGEIHFVEMVIGREPTEIEGVSEGEAAAPAPISNPEEDLGGETPPPSTYEDMLVADLKAECVARGLDDSGTKAELIARLEADDAGA